MQSTTTTRLLLGLILVCLLILIVQGFGGAGSGRYQVTGMRAGAPVLIRTDTESGRVWKLELRGGGDRWIPFLEPGESRSDAGATTGTEGVDAGAAAPGASASAQGSDTDAGQSPQTFSTAREDKPLTEGELQIFIDTLLGGELPADVRAWTALQLGPAEGVKVTDALLVALADPEPEVVTAAVDALSQRRDPRIAPALEKLAARGTPPLHDDLQIDTLD